VSTNFPEYLEPEQIPAHGRRTGNRRDRPNPLTRDGGVTHVKTLLALLVAVVFVVGSAGSALAQTPTPAVPEKKADYPAEKTMPVKDTHGTVKSVTADGVGVAGRQQKKEAEWT